MDERWRTGRVRQDVREAGLRHVVHMGMGGSSLAPLVFQRTFRTLWGSAADRPGHHRPGRRSFGSSDRCPWRRPSSSSPANRGQPRNPRLRRVLLRPVAPDQGRAGRRELHRHHRPRERPGSAAEERRYRRTFLGFPDIGGRYSALSHFGLVPAALMGLDMAEFLERALEWATPAFQRSLRRQPGNRPRRCPRRAGAFLARQAHLPDSKADRHPGPVAGAACRREHRQGRHRHSAIAGEPLAGRKPTGMTGCSSTTT